MLESQDNFNKFLKVAPAKNTEGPESIIKELTGMNRLNDWLIYASYVCDVLGLRVREDIMIETISPATRFVILTGPQTWLCAPNCLHHSMGKSIFSYNQFYLIDAITLAFITAHCTTMPPRYSRLADGMTS